MNNFVNSLVRRGAGLPLPIMIRPGVSPPNMPVALESHSANLDPSSAGSPAERTQPPASGPRIVDASPSTVSVQPFPQIPFREVFTRLRPPERPALEMKEKLAIPGEAPAAAQVINTQQITVLDENRPATPASHNDQGPEYSDQIAAAPKPMATTPLPQASQGHDAKKLRHASRDSDAVTPSRQGHQSPGGPARPATPEVSSTRVVPRQEAATLAPAVRQAPAAAFKKEVGVRFEPRNVQVKIGRVEIRSSQPAAPARVAEKQITRGFADLRLARTYLDRSGW